MGASAPFVYMILHQDGFLNVSLEQLSKLYERYGEEGAALFLNEYVDEHNLLFPITRPTLEEADADHERLLNFKSTTLLKNSKHQVGCKYPSEEFPLSTRYIQQNLFGCKASNYFHYHSRTHCEHERSPSPIRVWNTPKSRLGLFKAVFSLKKTHINNDVLASCISMRRYWASQHRPSTMKALIQKYARHGRVLDPCSGWGDRLEGFMASSAEEYVGCDPNLRLHLAYRAQIQRYMQDHQSARVHYSPFEKLKLESNYFDFAFTSPPYFNAEKYSNDAGQSYLNYGTPDVWIKKFLLPMVERTYDSLKPNGVMAINIANVYTQQSVQNICDPMNIFLRDKLGAREQKHIGYQMSKRANSNVPVDGVFCEPVFVWKKPKL